MSKIRSLLELQEEMASDFAWRRKELHQLKSVVIANPLPPKRDMCIRSAVALLYAHWEGFVKKIGTSYVKFVASQRLRHDSLAPNFLAMAAGTTISNAAGCTKFQVRMAVVNFFREMANTRSNLPWRSGVNTKANLNSEVLRDIVTSLGLDYSKYQTKEKLIDEKLLSNRNKIAHGQYLSLAHAEYLALHDDVMDLMQAFYDDIESAANQGQYLR